MKKLSLLFLLFLAAFNTQAQDLQAKLNLITNKVNSKVDKKIFQTLQSGLTNFLK